MNKATTQLSPAATTHHPVMRVETTDFEVYYMQGDDVSDAVAAFGPNAVVHVGFFTQTDLKG